MRREGRCHVRRQDSSDTGTVTTPTTTDTNTNKINPSSATDLTSPGPVVGVRNDGQHFLRELGIPGQLERACLPWLQPRHLGTVLPGHRPARPRDPPRLGPGRRLPDALGCETVIGHHKTDMGAGMAVLRSNDPEGVAQEMWALFAVYQAIHTLIGAAVDATGIPPDQISFPQALTAVTDTVTADFPPSRS